MDDSEITCCCCLDADTGFKILAVFALLSFANPWSFVSLIIYGLWINEDNKKNRQQIYTLQIINYVFAFIVALFVTIVYGAAAISSG